MRTPKFGSDWTAQKLGVVSDYSRAWAKIMHSQSRQYGWQFRYIDAFSGSYRPRKRVHSDEIAQQQAALFALEETEEELEEIKLGSARIAMNIEPKFDRIDLIERNPIFAESLRKISGDKLGKRVFVHCEDANPALASICQSMSQRRDRALVFIDPFGCQVEWSTLETVAATEIADVFYLFPTMGVNRQIFSSFDKIPLSTQSLLDRVLGTAAWRQEFYKTETVTDLFGEYEKTTRTTGPQAVEAFFIRRLRMIFPAVYPHCLRLKNTRNGHLFSLCFAVANPSKAAQGLAMRIVAGVMKKWEAKA